MRIKYTVKCCCSAGRHTLRWRCKAVKIFLYRWPIRPRPSSSQRKRCESLVRRSFSSIRSFLILCDKHEFRFSAQTPPVYKYDLHASYKQNTSSSSTPERLYTDTSIYCNRRFLFSCTSATHPLFAVLPRKNMASKTHLTDSCEMSGILVGELVLPCVREFPLARHEQRAQHRRRKTMDVHEKYSSR